MNLCFLGNDKLINILAELPAYLPLENISGVSLLLVIDLYIQTSKIINSIINPNKKIPTNHIINIPVLVFNYFLNGILSLLRSEVFSFTGFAPEYH